MGIFVCTARASDACSAGKAFRLAVAAGFEPAGVAPHALLSSAAGGSDPFGWVWPHLSRGSAAHCAPPEPTRMRPLAICSMHKCMRRNFAKPSVGRGAKGDE
jgi:hypothetical protein